MQRRMSSPTGKKQALLPRRMKAKPAWSEYLTEDKKFALTKEEMLRRKQTLLSKNSIFNGNSRSPTSNSQSATGKMTDTAKNKGNHNLGFKKLNNDFPMESTFLPKKSEEFTALDLLSKDKTSWEEDDEPVGTQNNEETILIGLTPTPEKMKNVERFSKNIMNPEAVERTIERHSRPYYSGGHISDSGDDDDENERSDDECNMGVLNLSNHDINDDDEVLQGAAVYHTPDTKSTYTPKYLTRNVKIMNTKNFTRVVSPISSPKGPTPEKIKTKTILPYGNTGKNIYKMSKSPVRIAKSKNDKKDSRDVLEENRADHQPLGQEHFMDSVYVDEMAEITKQIRTLNGELKYFEELTGKRCIFETEELETALDNGSDTNCDWAGSKNLNSIAVMRYLVQLVCQSMTFLLRGEVESQALGSKYSQLETKVDTLTRLLLPSHTGAAAMATGTGMGYGGYDNSGVGIFNEHTVPYGYIPHSVTIPTYPNSSQSGNVHPNQVFNSLSSPFSPTPYRDRDTDQSPHSANDLSSTYLSAHLSYLQAGSPGITPIQGPSPASIVDMRSGGHSSAPLSHTEMQMQGTITQTHIVNTNPMGTAALNTGNHTGHQSTTSAVINSFNNDIRSHLTTSHPHTYPSPSPLNRASAPHSSPTPLGTSTTDWLLAYTQHLGPENRSRNMGGIAIPGFVGNTPQGISAAFNPESVTLSGGNSREVPGSVVYPDKSLNSTNTLFENPTPQRRLFSQSSQFSLPTGSYSGQMAHTPIVNSTLHSVQSTSIATKSYIDDEPYNRSTNIPTGRSAEIAAKNLAQSFFDVDASLNQIEKSRTSGLTNSASYSGRSGIQIQSPMERGNVEINRTADYVRASDVSSSESDDIFNNSDKRHSSPNSVAQSTTPEGNIRNTQSQTPVLSGQWSSKYPVYKPDPTSVPRSGPTQGSVQIPVQVPTQIPVEGSGLGQGQGQSSSSSHSRTQQDNRIWNENNAFREELGSEIPHYAGSVSRTSSRPSSSSPSSASSIPPSPHHTKQTTTSSYTIQPHGRIPNHNGLPLPPSNRNTPESPHSTQSSTSSTQSSSYPRPTPHNRDQEQGSVYVPSTHIPLPATAPSHPFSVKNTTISLSKPLNNESNKPVYDARYGSFSRK